ncbi:MAG: hypothetical protein M3Y57_14045 [Acidobacteriota bacterium]|nr:hypothetical protein [Acidobacteriota bacterium]
MVATGLLIRSFLRVLDVNLGFQPASAAALRIDPSAQVLRVDPKSKKASIEQISAYFDDVLRRVRELPGVEAAGLTDALPLGRNRTWGGALGVVYKRGEYPEAFVHVVSGGYLKAAGIALKDGRDFNERDTSSSEPVILVNETLGRRLWPGQNPDRKADGRWLGQSQAGNRRSDGCAPFESGAGLRPRDVLYGTAGSGL